MRIVRRCRCSGTGIDRMQSRNQPRGNGIECSVFVGYYKFGDE